jgi:MOB kinase activator 1
MNFVFFFCFVQVETQLNDEHIFPLQLGTPFPKNFQSVVKVIFKRLFRVYAHIYHSHFQKIVGLGAEAHLNTCSKHFILFVLEFGLVDKQEMAPLKDLIDAFLTKDHSQSVAFSSQSAQIAEEDDSKLPD